MAIDAGVVEGVQRRITTLWPLLNERQRRLLLGVEARELGWGGVSTVATAMGVSRSTVTNAVAELELPTQLPEGRSRRAGGGRKSAVEHDPGLGAALDALVDPETRGDPESALRWTCKSTRQLAAALTADGHAVWGPHGRGAAASVGLQLAGQRQDHRGHLASGPGRPVRPHQHSGSSLPQDRRSGDQR